MKMPKPNRRELEIMDILGGADEITVAVNSATPRRPPGAPFRRGAPAIALAFAVTLACTSSAPAPRGSHDFRATAEAEAIAPPAGAAGDREEGPVWLTGASVRPLRPPAMVQEGFLEEASVVREMERRVGDLARCYERRRLVRPELSGMVFMRWTINTKGVVPERSVNLSYLDDDEVLSCLKQTIKETRFPESTGGTMEVSYRFYFGSPPPPLGEEEGC
jgi:hypothetical protein